MVDVEVTDLCVSVPLVSWTWAGRVSTPQEILQRVNARFRKGHVTAVMGGSGSGKTTCINAITGRLFHQAHVTGSVTFDGLDPVDLIPRVCAYVKQGDFLLPHLTGTKHPVIMFRIHKRVCVCVCASVLFNRAMAQWNFFHSYSSLFLPSLRAGSDSSGDAQYRGRAEIASWPESG